MHVTVWYVLRTDKEPQYELAQKLFFFISILCISQAMLCSKCNNDFRQSLATKPLKHICHLKHEAFVFTSCCFIRNIRRRQSAKPHG